MGKLFNLKEWLTLADSARHLAIVFGEDVTEADVLQLALDGHLRLSVNFVNHARARCGKVVRYTEAELAAAFESGTLPDDLKWRRLPRDLAAAVQGGSGGGEVIQLISLRIDEERYLTLSDDVTTLRGVWDLPMIGGERLDIEHQYQTLTDGPSVTLGTLDGAFVEGGDGSMCQLLEAAVDSNAYQAAASAQLESLKHHIALNGIEGAEAESLLNRHNERWREIIEKRKARAAKDCYYPAGGLPEDAVIVVRTEALREFERQIADEPSPASHAHVSDKLAKMNQASTKFWSNAGRDDRGTHPDNRTVAAWLVRQGFSTTLADKAATIIRPEWAPLGRKPEQ